MELFIDTETSGIYRFGNSYKDPKQPWIVQLGFILSDIERTYAECNLIIKANNRTIEPGAKAVHGITEETSNLVGLDEIDVFKVIADISSKSSQFICHNVQFDLNILRANFFRSGFNLGLCLLDEDKYYCTMKKTTDLCKIPGKYGKYKWPKLMELHQFLFGEKFEDAHDALADVKATRRCYYELVKRGWVKGADYEQSNESPS